MIQYTTGDLFQSGADCLINTVNCEGYMGKGIAYQFKLQFPENNKSYVVACKSGELRVGKVHVFVEKGVTIVNFPTKNGWRESSRLSYIETGLQAFLEILPHLNVKTVAIPPLGCGNGGLEWNIVKAILLEKLRPLEETYSFLIYEPQRGYVQKAMTAPQLSTSSLVLMKITMGLKRRTKLRLQKTAYFMNLFLGESYFSFQKHKYGPYAHSIEIISRQIGEYQSFYGIKDTESTYQMVYQVICSAKTTKSLNKLFPAIEKAMQYVNEIDSEHDLEGISTIIYLVQTMNDESKMKLITDFNAWSEDKSARFSDEEIKTYIEFAEDTGMIKIDIMGFYNIAEHLFCCESFAM